MFLQLLYQLVQKGIDYDNKIVFAAAGCAGCAGGGRGLSAASRAGSHSPQEARRQLMTNTDRFKLWGSDSKLFILGIFKHSTIQ